MQLFNLKHPDEQVSFSQAVKLGLGKDRGLFFPTQIPQIEDINTFLAEPFVVRSQQIMRLWLADEISSEVTDKFVSEAFNFTLPLVKVDQRSYCLELFHGPTLAFKDFGARFMAQCLNHLSDDEEPLTILTATSGDTGAAVADAFYGLDKVRVVVLYPQDKISPLQEKLFTTLGGNIHTFAIASDFDACQALVKQAFDDQTLRSELSLNSANSINISRLLAQICYYFEAVAQFKRLHPDLDPVISVPSGNFGNLTAGLLAQAMGLPVKRFIAATNSNDTVPRYLDSGLWHVNPTVATLSNAMDVSDPSNWPRVEAIFEQLDWSLTNIHGVTLSEDQTIESMQKLTKNGYQSEPHGAIAAKALVDNLDANEKGIFLGTAHPAKFKDVVDKVQNTCLPLPEVLAKVANKQGFSQYIQADFAQFKQSLLSLT